MTVFDHAPSFMENAIKRLGHTLEEFAAKNSKVQKKANYSYISIHASLSDANGNSFDKGYHH